MINGNGYTTHDPPEPEEPDCIVYSLGLVCLSVCSKLPAEETAAWVNDNSPTGISSQWQLSEEFFGTGQPNPCPCNTDPTRQHFLFNC